MITHASLFSGIGGFDLAAEWCGFENAFTCEIDGFCNQVLKYHFPTSIHYDDIKQTDFSRWRGKIDILSGGFPCQPFSLAGRRKGAEDDRYLWPYMLRAVKTIKPHWIVGENVAGILTMVQPYKEVRMEGVTGIFGACDPEFIQSEKQWGTLSCIIEDLEREGYSVQTFVVPACVVGAPHRRDRIWIVANRTDAGAETLQCGRKNGISTAGVAANSKSEQSQRAGFKQPCISEQEQRKFGRGDKQGNTGEVPNWDCFPTQSPVCRRDDGLPFDVARLTLSFPKWRKESVKCLGNAIVPQVAYEIFKAIKELEQ